MKLRNLLVFGAALGLSVAGYAETAKQVNNATVAATTQQATAGKADLKDKVNINTADVSALMTVKGIGQRKAQAIVDYRTKNGSFKAVPDLLNVKGKGCRGINQKWLDKVSPNLTV
jgi:competence protein ComEA